MKKLDVYDFDDTIYKGDSTLDYFFFNLKKKPTLIKYLPSQLKGLILYKIKLRKKEYFKEKFFSFLKSIDKVEENVENFWNENEYKIKRDLLKLATNKILVISASPEFLLTNVCKKYKIDYLIATKVDSQTGIFLTMNCYGKEKVNRYNELFCEYTIDKFYSDSLTDKYLAEISEKSYLVKGDIVKEWKHNKK